MEVPLRVSNIEIAVGVFKVSDLGLEERFGILSIDGQYDLLQVACRANHNRVIEYFICRKGLDINYSENDIPLLWLVSDVETARFMVDLGARVSTQLLDFRIKKHKDFDLILFYTQKVNLVTEEQLLDCIRLRYPSIFIEQILPFAHHLDQTTPLILFGVSRIEKDNVIRPLGLPQYQWQEDNVHHFLTLIRLAKKKRSEITDNQTLIVDLLLKIGGLSYHFQDSSFISSDEMIDLVPIILGSSFQKSCIFYPLDKFTHPQYKHNLFLQNIISSQSHLHCECECCQQCVKDLVLSDFNPNVDSVHLDIIHRGFSSQRFIFGISCELRDLYMAASQPWNPTHHSFMYNHITRAHIYSIFLCKTVMAHLCFNDIEFPFEIWCYIVSFVRCIPCKFDPAYFPFARFKALRLFRANGFLFQF